LLNNDLILQWAQSFAGRVLNDSGLAPDAQVDRAFKLAYGRSATTDEQKFANDFLAKQTALLNNKTNPTLPTNVPAGMDKARAAAFVDLSQMLLDSNEFLYIN